ncbi:helix-turn-helix domain-containing protein [Archaeoglobus neptunius]|uniref:helix-turn-helix domain-containing protein n=1 Tax=Archaeoglobus neptunius TaxID=2798580 RepID=UPI002ED84008
MDIEKEYSNVAERICGNIVLAESSGEAMRKWRGIFSITQSDLAKKIGVRASVISDYESGRRSPGINFVRKFVLALIDLDRERGYPTLSKYRYIIEDSKAILDMVEYSRTVGIGEFCDAVEGVLLNDFEKLIHGHTFVDSIVAIMTFNAFDFYKLYGLTSERAIVFTQVSSGRSPMVAVRVSNLKPSAVVLHGIEADSVDRIAMKIAEVERIPLIVSDMGVGEMIDELRRRFA